MSKLKEFKTDSLGLAPYLQLNGLKYLRSEVAIGKNDRPVVAFVFEDSLGVGKDLELDFMHSNEKKYRDMTFFFRNEISKLSRQIDHLNRKESRKSDDKYIDEHFDRKKGN